MTGPTYTVRASSLMPERAYRLEDDGMHWQDEKSQGRTTYSDIAIVKLMRLPGLGADFIQCRIKSTSGDKIVLTSNHYKSLGSFEDRSQACGVFLTELFRRTAAVNPDARFLVGSTGFWVMWLVLFIASIGIIVGMVFAFASDDLPIKAILPVAIMLIFAPAAWRTIRRGRARQFDPNNPPTELLGG